MYCTKRLFRLALYLAAAGALCELSEATAGTDCTCGYSVNSTTSPTHAVFTEILETDFSHLWNIGAFSQPCWRPQQYEVAPASARGPYGKSANLSNVKPNPYPSWDTWKYLGKDHVHDAGLQFWVNAQPVNTSSGQVIRMGEIASKRTDILYGSFRIAMRLTGTPGTCGAFFFYRNNSQEIDMEFLSANITSDSKPVYLIMQTPESVAEGYNAAGTETFRVIQLDFNPSDGFHEYRFDWLQGRVSFYADGGWVQDLEWTYPEAPGDLSINHWSNGDPSWSGGPPAIDAVLTVLYIKAYFNSSTGPTNDQYNRQCLGASNSQSICQIPNAKGQPDGAYQFGTWFNRGMCGEAVNSSTGTSPVSSLYSSSAAPSSGATKIRFGTQSHGDEVTLAFARGDFYTAVFVWSWFLLMMWRL